MASVEEIKAALTEAMKRRDAVATAALRSALAAIREAEVAGDEKRELTSEDIEGVLAKQVKRREEAAEAFRDGGRTDRAEQEEAEREVLAAFLPPPLSPEELEAIVDEVLEEEDLRGVGAMGQAMGPVMERVGKRADGKTVSQLVRARLEERDA